MQRPSWLHQTHLNPQKPSRDMILLEVQVSQLYQIVRRYGIGESKQENSHTRKDAVVDKANKQAGKATVRNI